jgi:dihydrofolate reductase
MPTIVLYIASSIDGYIARPDGSVDWLSVVDGFDTDYGYQAFYDSVDALLMGSNTYAQVQQFGDWPYTGKTAYVFSSRDWSDTLADVQIAPPDVGATLPAIKHYHKVWLVGGAALVKSFHEAGLIDEYIISIIPVVLGDGIALFQSPLTEQPLKLLSAQHYASGLVQLHYQKYHP